MESKAASLDTMGDQAYLPFCKVHLISFYQQLLCVVLDDIL